ncbi:MAG TPA: glycoside hydrolase family 57 protein [Prolixibacteraceae bacterium]|nr:glycoside hydrolase family 57 protein [Prolixibacteraceae bacterium]
MKSLCLIFRVHQPLPLRKYRFFDIGADHGYYDDYTLENHMKKLAVECYLPATDLLLNQVSRYGGAMKAAIYLSGSTLELLNRYTPGVTARFRELASTGQIEFLGGTWSHSLACLASEQALALQAGNHQAAIRDLTGQTTEVFLNPGLLYSDEIGQMAANLGYKGIITEGARHILGWKSPGFLYCNPLQPRLKVLMRHYKLSEDLECRFSDPHWEGFPLTADKYFGWLLNGGQPAESIHLCLDLETFGHYHPASSGIFRFLDHLLYLINHSGEISLSTPSEILNSLQPVSMINVPNPLSQAGEERDASLWIGNDLQNEALNLLYGIADMVTATQDPRILCDWHQLQDSEHFRFMSENTPAPPLHHRKSPYNSPYEAFLNYMNILNDLTIRVKSHFSGPSPEEIIRNLKNRVNDLEKEIEKSKEEIHRLRKRKKGH